MAKKNLARTAIEGGRYHHNSWERRHSHGIARAREREVLGRLTADPSAADEIAGPARKRVRKMFYDKLRPVERWLARQAGRPWNDVYSEIKKRFDSRTTAGRHILYDHLLAYVEIGERHGWPWRGNMAVGSDGILRIQDGFRWQRKRVRERGVWVGREALARFSGGRRIGRQGEIWFWFVPVRPRCAVAPLAFRQDRRMEEREVAFFLSLKESQQLELTFEKR
jgi:hypothetical protein